MRKKLICAKVMGFVIFYIFLVSYLSCGEGQVAYAIAKDCLSPSLQLKKSSVQSLFKISQQDIRGLVKANIVLQRKSPSSILKHATAIADVVALGEIHGSIEMLKTAAKTVSLFTHLAFEGNVEHQRAFEIFMEAWINSGEENLIAFVEKNLKIELIPQKGKSHHRIKMNSLASAIFHELPEQGIEWTGRPFKKEDIIYKNIGLSKPLALIGHIVGYYKELDLKEKYYLFKQAYTAKVIVVFVDSRTPYEDGNEKMAKNIASIITINKGVKVLFYGGNAHVKKGSEVLEFRIPRPDGSQQQVKNIVGSIEYYITKINSEIKVYTILQDSSEKHLQSEHIPSPAEEYIELLGIDVAEGESYALENLGKTLLGDIADAIIIHGNTPTSIQEKSTKEILFSSQNINSKDTQQLFEQAI